MDIQRYKELSGNSSISDEKITSAIGRTQNILEDLLGYTLDPDKVSINQYPDLDPVNAFRIFLFNRGDAATRIDPNTAVHSVRFLRQDGGLQEIESDDFHTKSDRGYIQYIAFWNMLFPGWPTFLVPSFINFRCQCDYLCEHLQLVVDADWAWPADEIPDELLYVWADMITYYADDNREVKSQTLGSHSYTKYDRIYPENVPQNASIISRYAGPRGTAFRTIVL